MSDQRGKVQLVRVSETWEAYICISGVWGAANGHLAETQIVQWSGHRAAAHRAIPPVPTTDQSIPLVFRGL